MRFLSPLTLRLLAFNLLLVFLPAAGFLYLDTYERKMLAAQERSMVQQGRSLAAALSGQEEAWRDQAGPLLKRLERRTDARLRVIDRDGLLLADSSLLGPRAQADGDAAADERSLRDAALYRAGATLIRLVPRRFRRPAPAGDVAFYSSSNFLEGREVIAALAGRYGAATRISAGGQRSVTLYSALPIRRSGDVVGVVLVSQSTFRILEALYEVRLGVFKIFLATVVVAVILSLLVATTIARPLRRLARQAKEIVDRRGRLRGHFKGSKKKGEIGDLARALESLTHRLEHHIQFIESFASDVSHELKNPLTAVRTATELLSEAETREERDRFLDIVQREVARMERLLSEVREITSIDAQLEEEPVRDFPLDELAKRIVDGFNLRSEVNGRIRFHPPSEPASVAASPERVTQVIENLLENALSFSPDGQKVDVRVEADGDRRRLSVEDRGPGIPPEHRAAVFRRFFSYRPDEEGRSRQHAGLGLAIVKTIAESYGGSVAAHGREGGGTRVMVELPAA